MKICAATGNAGKLRELRRILEAQGHEVVSQKELGITIEPDETGTTFAENALIKAETICKVSGLPTIADDSGLCVDALGGAPGVYSARYCGHHGDDEANNDKLLDAMKEVPEGKRGAKFVSAVCFILPDGRHLTCMGECPGSIAFERLNGDYGFGYAPLFIPADCGVGKRDKRPNTEHRSYAQLTPDEKDAISHRGNAAAGVSGCSQGRRHHRTGIWNGRDRVEIIIRLKQARPLRLTLFGTSPGGRGLGKTTNFISSPEAFPLGELARKCLRGRGR